MAKATKDVEAAMAGEAQVRRDQEAEREKVKRAITDLRRKLDRWVHLSGGMLSLWHLAGGRPRTILTGDASWMGGVICQGAILTL